MPTPGEPKTVQARILAYAEAIGWTIVSRKEAEERRAGFPTRRDGENAGRNARAPLSLFVDNLLDANPPSPRGYGVAGRHLH
jgi:type I restriction enzyme R subunit